MRVTFGVLVAKKTMECDHCLRIMESLELRTFTLRKRIVMLLHLVKARRFRGVAKERQSELAKIKCKKLRMTDIEGTES